MALDFRYGRADTLRYYQEIAQTAANHPQGYEQEHYRDWAFGKLLPRMESGLAIPCPVYYRDELAAFVVGYPEPAEHPGEIPSVEAKLVRTLGRFAQRGCATIGFKTLIASAAEEMNLPPGSPIRVHLDTRNPEAIMIFSNIGLRTVAEAQLYTPDPEAPDLPDVLMEMIATTPPRL